MKFIHKTKKNYRKTLTFFISNTLYINNQFENNYSTHIKNNYKKFLQLITRKSSLPITHEDNQ